MTQQLHNDQEATYVTYDLALCCALLCFDFTLAGLETTVNLPFLRTPCL